MSKLKLSGIKVRHVLQVQTTPTVRGERESFGEKFVPVLFSTLSGVDAMKRVEEAREPKVG